MKSIVVGLSFLCLATTAEALIQAKMPMSDVMAQSQFVFEATVADVVPQQPGVMLSFKENLKGAFPIMKMPVNMQGDAECKNLKHTPQLMKRLAKDLPVIVFINHNETTKTYQGFVYTNGTWFHVRHDASKGEVWSLTHGEPNLRKTFKGTTAEMKTIVTDYLKTRKRLPADNPKEAAGFGPEVEAK